jgi:hypothetical protein
MMFQKLVAIGFAATLLGSTVCLAQESIEDLRHILAEKDAEIQRKNAEIKQKDAEIQRLTQRVTVSDQAPAQGPAPSMPPQTSDEDINRALERALVRQGGLLLSSGTAEIGPNLQYSHQSIDTIAFRRDAFGPALDLSVGLPWSSQFAVQVPYVIEYRRTAVGSHNSNGLGDISLSLSHQLVDDQEGVPGLIGAFNYSIATGRNTLFSQPVPIGLGTGFDSAGASLTAVKRVDPLVLFATYAFMHNFSGTQGGNSVDLGNSNGLRFGTILATSPATSLRTDFSLTFFDKTRFNGIAFSGTDEPAAIFELGGSVLVWARTLFDVSVGAGVTRNSPDFRLNLAASVRL